MPSFRDVLAASASQPVVAKAAPPLRPAASPVTAATLAALARSIPSHPKDPR